MVAYNKQQETDEQCVGAKDIVCPQCFKSLLGGAQIAVVTEDDRYDRRLRRYVGLCQQCDKYWEVVQFKKGERWVIHKYQCYAAVAGGSLPAGGWVTLNELPEPAVIVTGPGGQYDKQITPKQSELLNKMLMSVRSMCQTLKCLVKSMGMKQ